MGFVRVRNDKTKGEAVVSETALPVLEPKGWKRTDRGAPAPTPAEVTTATTSKES